MTAVMPLVRFLLRLKFRLYTLSKDRPLPITLRGELRQYENHVCSAQDFSVTLLIKIKVSNGDNGFIQKETGTKSIAMVTT